MSGSSAFAPFFAKIHKECLPGIWSKGMALHRDGRVRLDSAEPSELVLRIVAAAQGSPVSPQVTLWPQDDDSHCDCGDRNEICAHIAAAVIALRAGLAPSAPKPETRVHYRFRRERGALRLERTLSVGGGAETPLADSLVALAGGIGSGRLSMPALSATSADFAVDRLLQAPAPLARVLAALAHHGDVRLDARPVRVSARPTGMRAIVEEVPGGFKLRGEMDPSITEIFSNGAVLCGDLLRGLEVPRLTQAELSALSREGSLYRAPGELARLVSELLPGLEAKLPLELRTERLPLPRTGVPRISLGLEPGSGNELLVLAALSYPEPAGPGEILLPDPAAELRLSRKLQSELHLKLGQPARFAEGLAVDFMLKVQGAPGDWLDILRIHGTGARRFSVARALEPRFEAGADGFSLSFVAAGEGDRQASAQEVVRAWRDGADYVPLLGGGLAPLPRDWLDRFGPRIAALLDARGPDGKLARACLPELGELCTELGHAVPDGIRALCGLLENRAGLPRAALPLDLTASLRDYQRQGVDWLCFLRDGGMGALLADDMGLGKTLQTLCAIRGSTLVVCPTSVLSGWSEQLRRFRPGLRAAVFHGPHRELDPRADVTLTTYAILRMDRGLLTSRPWDTLVLDEAQTIKNPASQVARAAHALQGSFRIALTGTPIENRLGDLWSQFQFACPGLLGTRATFLESFGREPSRLRARIRPFCLRRLKKDVAVEAPPRTEILLHCELTDAERELYDSIRAATRRKVAEKLDKEPGTPQGTMAVLEMLLRLRQACCHPGLVPGGPQPASSSKLELLLGRLGESVALGHRALVFSQWTSFLDLIEPKLTEAGLGFLRLDGSTPHRERVIEAFQAPEGPPVFLISLKAGGVGLTLTAADHVYLMDPWWNPAVEEQAADRVHRIGQENPVLIQRLVARDTVEDRINALQRQKLELADSVLEGGGAGIALTKEDLLELLA